MIGLADRERFAGKGGARKLHHGRMQRVVDHGHVAYADILVPVDMAVEDVQIACQLDKHFSTRKRKRSASAETNVARSASLKLRKMVVKYQQ